METISSICTTNRDRNYVHFTPCMRFKDKKVVTVQRTIAKSERICVVQVWVLSTIFSHCQRHGKSCILSSGVVLCSLDILSGHFHYIFHEWSVKIAGKVLVIVNPSRLCQMHFGIHFTKLKEILFCVEYPHHQ